MNNRINKYFFANSEHTFSRKLSPNQMKQKIFKGIFTSEANSFAEGKLGSNGLFRESSSWIRFSGEGNVEPDNNLRGKFPADGLTGVKGKNTVTNKFYNQCFDKGRLKNFVLWFLNHYGEHKTVKLVEQLKNVGFDYASKAGISLGIDDLKIPPKKTELIYDAEKQTKLTVNQYVRGEITGVERFQRLIDTWHRTSEILKQEVIEYFEATDLLNPVYMMAFSGARGNISQVRQLVGMRGLMADPQGQIIDFPIRSNFREGLTLTEYIISSYGARKGIVDTALRTANAGYLTRRLVDVAQHVIISNFDCGTRRGIFLIDMKEGTKTIHSLTQRAVGRILARDLFVVNGDKKTKIASRNDEITLDLAFEIGKKFEKIFVRSPLTCETSKLICQLCYGWSLAQGNLVSIGEAVGVVAAQSIGEPGTQLTMRTFHTGGVFSGDISDQIRAPFDGIVEYISAIPGTLIRTPEGKIAFLTKSEGAFFVRKTNASNDQIVESKKFQIPFYTLLYIRNGQKVYEKEVIAQISSISRKKNATDDAELTIKSEYEGQFYSKSLGFREKQVGPKQRLNKSAESNQNFTSVQADIPVAGSLTVDKTRYKQISLQNYQNFEENKGIDKFFEAWTWGYAWVLSGKIYELQYTSGIFPKIGDVLNYRSIMNQTKWQFNTNSGSMELYLAKNHTGSSIAGGAFSETDKRQLNVDKGGKLKLNANSFSKLNKTYLTQVGNRLLKPFISQPLLSFDLHKIWYKKYGYSFQIADSNKLIVLNQKPHKTNSPFNSSKTQTHYESHQVIQKQNEIWNSLPIQRDCLFYLKSLNSNQNTNLYPYIVQWFPALFQTKTGGYIFFESSAITPPDSSVNKKITRKINFNESIKSEDFTKNQNKYKQKYKNELVEITSNERLTLNTPTSQLARFKIQSLSSTVKTNLIKQNFLNQSSQKTTASVIGLNSPKGNSSQKATSSIHSKSTQIIPLTKYALFGMRWRNSHEIWATENSVSSTIGNYNADRNFVNKISKNVQKEDLRSKSSSVNRFYNESNLLNFYSSRMFLISNHFYKLKIKVETQLSKINELNFTTCSPSILPTSPSTDPSVFRKISFNIKQYRQFFNLPLFIVTNRQGNLKQVINSRNELSSAAEDFSILKLTTFQYKVKNESKSLASAYDNFGLSESIQKYVNLTRFLNALKLSQLSRINKVNCTKSINSITAHSADEPKASLGDNRFNSNVDFSKLNLVIRKKEIQSKNKKYEKFSNLFSESGYTIENRQFIQNVKVPYGPVGNSKVTESDSYNQQIKQKLILKKTHSLLNNRLVNTTTKSVVRPLNKTSKVKSYSVSGQGTQNVYTNFLTFCKKTFVLNQLIQNLVVSNQKPLLAKGLFEENRANNLLFILKEDSFISNYLIDQYMKFFIIKNKKQFVLVMANGKNYKETFASENSFVLMNSKKQVLLNKEIVMKKMSFVGNNEQIKSILVDKMNSQNEFSSSPKSLATKTIVAGYPPVLPALDNSQSEFSKGPQSKGPSASVKNMEKYTNIISIKRNQNTAIHYTNLKKGWVFVTTKIHENLHKQFIYPGKDFLSQKSSPINISFDVPIYLEYIVVPKISTFKDQLTESLNKKNDLSLYNFSTSIKNKRSRYFNDTLFKKSDSDMGQHENAILLIQPVKEYNQFDFSTELKNSVYESMSTRSTIGLKFQNRDFSSRISLSTMKRIPEGNSLLENSLKKILKENLLYEFGSVSPASVKAPFMVKPSALNNDLDFNSIKNRLKIKYKKSAKLKNSILVSSSFESIFKLNQYRTKTFNKQKGTSQPLSKFPSSDLLILSNNIFNMYLSMNQITPSVVPSGPSTAPSLKTSIASRKNRDRDQIRKTNVQYLVARKPLNLNSFLISYTKPFNPNFSFKYTKTSFSYQAFTKCDSILDRYSSKHFLNYLNSFTAYASPSGHSVADFAARKATVLADNSMMGKIQKMNSQKTCHSIYPLISRFFESPRFLFSLVSYLNLSFFTGNKIKTALTSQKASPFLNAPPVKEYGSSQSYKRLTSATKFVYSYENKLSSSSPIAKTNYYSPFKGEVVYISTIPTGNLISQNLSTVQKQIVNKTQNKDENLYMNPSCMVLTKTDLISYYLPSTFSEYKEILTLNQKNKYVISDILISFLKMTDINLTNLQPYLQDKDLTKTNLKISQLVAGKPLKPYSNLLGDFFVYGDQISKTMAVESAGQIIHYNYNKVTLRRAQPILISPRGILHKFDGDFIDPKTPVITLSYQRLKTGDIIQGIPKVEQFFEARTTKRGRLFRDSLPSLLKALFKRYQSKLPLDLAVRQSFYKIQQIIVDGVQRVYKSQGVTIADKHLEVIVKQMTSKVRIIDGAQTGFFPGEVVDLEFVEKINTFLIKKITYEPLVLGITKASLEVDSFLSAASFQQTTRVLSKAAISRKKDFLKGLKENVILGNLIPAGTGFLVYLNDFDKK